MPMTRTTTSETALEFRPTLKATDELIKSLLDDNGDHLSDAVFFSKLQELRREHKRSLKLMEDLYKEKLLEKTAAQRRSRSALGRRDSDASYSALENEKNESKSDQKNEIEKEDFIRFLTAETRQAYLEARRRGEPPFKLPTSALLADSNDYDGQQDLESMAGSYISDSYFPQDWENMSLQEVLRSARSALSDTDSEDEEVRVRNQDDKARRVEKRRHSTAVDGGKEEVEILGQKWEPKTTVAVPFRMTIREEATPIRASYSQNFLNQILKEEEEKKNSLKAKAERGFRAKAVPASTYLPLYEELLKKNEERRDFIRTYSKEMLQDKLKPFNWAKNQHHGDQHRRRCVSVDDLRSDSQNADDKKVFKAKPVPKRVLNGTVDAEIRHREQQRYEKKMERADELLKNSKWPVNMQAISRAEIRQALQSRRQHNQCIDNGWTFTPQIKKKVPDFSALHDNFQRTIGEAKLKGSRVTVPEPFDLRINSRPRKPHHHETHKDAVKRHHNANRRSRSMVSLSSNANEDKQNKKSATSKSNTAAVLREAAIKRQLNDKNNQNVKMVRHLHQKETEEGKMREKMRAKLIDYDLSRETKERERAEQRRSTNQSSQVLYDQFKKSISEKMSDRQSLLDRQNMLAAKQSIEKRYRKALESAGLKGASVTTAISSIEKLLLQDRDAAAAVSAAIESDQSIDLESAASRSIRSAPSSESGRSDESSSRVSESLSKSDDNTIVVSKKPTQDATSNENSDQEGMANDTFSETEHIENQINVQQNGTRQRNNSDVKDMFDD